MNTVPKRLIIIAGSTAVGKTDFAITVAQKLNTEIISADSRQCYKELNIGVARPSIEELNLIPHHFIASHSITDTINAAWYEQYALALLDQLFEKYNTVVMVGGTGLYIKALMEGMDYIPDIPDTVRKQVMDLYQLKGLESLHQILKSYNDPFMEQGEMLNPQRVMRAVEVLLHTGKSIIEFKKGSKASRDFEINLFGLEMDRALLYQRINSRVDIMMQEGLLAEVEGLLDMQNLNALQTVGYKELYAYFNNECSLDKAVEEIKKNTRRYAKRQMTWFKNQENIVWLDAVEKEKSLNQLLEIVQ